MDIHAGLMATALLAVVFAWFSLRGGLRALQSARKMTFYRLRRQRQAGGWRLLGLALLLLALALWLPFYGEPLVYQYFPPSPTPSRTPTITPIPTLTLSPTMTLSPTITDTPVITDTPTITPTPFIPLAVLALFQSSITPNPEAVFSPLQFSTKMENMQAVAPTTFFQNPVGHMYATFTYDKMLPGVQWTALWYYEGHLVHAETKPWDGATGGYGFADWNPSPDQWKPGRYEVQLFVGEEWKVVGRFFVAGEPPTLTPTRTPTPTFTPTPTRTSSPTPASTPSPSGTPLPPSPTSSPLSPSTP